MAHFKVRGRVRVSIAYAWAVFTALVVSITGCIFAPNENADDTPQQASIQTVYVYGGSQLEFPWDYRYESAQLIAKDEFRRLGILMAQRESGLPPSPVQYFGISTCDVFFTDINMSRSQCGGTPAMLWMYARFYRYAYQLTDSATYRKMEFGVKTHYAEIGKSILGVSTDDIPGGEGSVDSAYLYKAAFVFQNEIQDAFNIFFGSPAPFDSLPTFTSRLLGLALTHELGHHVVGLEHANYDTLNAGTNSLHNMNGPRCIMTTRFRYDTQVDDVSAGYPRHFCKDTDISQTNSCADNAIHGLGQ